MKLNTVIELPDGRIGTICFRHLIGDGGVWGRHVFTMPDGGFGDELPPPDFILRDKSLQDRFTYECVGEEFAILEETE